MTARAAHLIHEALQLSPEERADMAAELLASLDEPEDADVEAAWAEEIERRARRVLAGESPGTDWVEARARLKAGRNFGSAQTVEQLECLTAHEAVDTLETP